MATQNKRIVLDYSNATKQFDKAIIDFIRETETEFNPPISHRTDINQYIHKIMQEAVVLFTVEEGTGNVSGLSAFYCNPSDYSFSFLSYIATKERGKGIGLCLLDASLEYIKKAGMKGMDTQTWESNTGSRRLFTKAGFVEQGVVSNRENGEKSILLRYEFSK